MRPFFSIVIPVYNAELHICKTIQSIQDQTHKDFEVIMVDDGSTDGSVNICQAITKEDSRFALIRKENAGVSTARNIGISQAQGNYILFIDSDDWIEKDTLAICYNCLENTKADELIFGMSFDIEKNNSVQRSIIKSHYEEEFLFSNFTAAFKSLYECNYLTSSCNRAISLRILKANNLFFDERISNYEDYEFSLRILGYCESVMVIPNTLYHYIIRHDSSNSRKYKPDMIMQLPVICDMLAEDTRRITDNEKSLEEIYATFQDVFWAGIYNICKGPKPVDSIKRFCSQEWVVEKLPMKVTGNRYNDVSLRLYEKKHWHLLYLWNRFAMVVRLIRY